VAVDLVFRDGSSRRSEGVVAAHLMTEGRSAVLVRLLSLERPGPRGGAAGALDDGEPFPGAPAPAPEEPGEDGPPGAPDLAAARRPPGDPFEASGDVIAILDRRVGRAQRGALVLLALALVVAGAGYSVVRSLAPTRVPEPAAAVAEHLLAAERLAADGRFAGDGGAIAQLLAAQRLDPGNTEIGARLARIADQLEALGARALRRNDLAVAKVHLAAAQQAAPDRPSIRARLEAIAKRTAREPPRRGRSATASAPR